MQHDIVSNTASLLGADDPAAGGAVEGYLTSGGTESLLQAVKTARDVGRDRGMARPQVVAGESAHAAFTKAADYFDVDLVRVPVDADFRVRADALADACTDETIMVVGSAPTYPQGVIDPIADIAALALRARHPVPRRRLHGRLPPALPGRARPPGRALRLPGARRDVHVGRRAQVRLRVEGRLGDPVPDARAGPQAAVRDHRLAGRLLRLDGHGRDPAGRAGRRGLGRPDAHRPRRLPRAHPHGARRGAGAAGRGSSPSTASRCAATRRPRCWPSAPGDPDALDIFAVGERLAAEGWYLDRQNRPDSLHATVHAGSAATVPALVADLRRAVDGGRVEPHRAARHDLRAEPSPSRAPWRPRRRSTRSSPRRAGRTDRAGGPTRGSASWRACWARSRSS